MLTETELLLNLDDYMFLKKQPYFEFDTWGSPMREKYLKRLS